MYERSLISPTVAASPRRSSSRAHRPLDARPRRARAPSPSARRRGSGRGPRAPGRPPRRRAAPRRSTSRLSLRTPTPARRGGLRPSASRYSAAFTTARSGAAGSTAASTPSRSKTRGTLGGIAHETVPVEHRVQDPVDHVTAAPAARSSSSARAESPSFTSIPRIPPRSIVTRKPSRRASSAVCRTQ